MEGGESQGLIYIYKKEWNRFILNIKLNQVHRPLILA